MVSTDVKDWSKDILEWYKGGDFDVEVASKLEVPIREFHEQIRSNVAFGRLIEYGRTLSEAFWVSQVKKNLNNKTFNNAAWALVMKNQFNWAEKNEQANTDVNPNMNADELREKITKEYAALVKKHAPELAKSRDFLESVRE